ncbi:tetratricopeptide repeat protein [Burkholderia multivorans]|uniref:tetratricopeptide repeat protein n=1 Tax=Burkholderia multivorans TaxID=87883 RepID=UPI00075ECE6E|nr:tetratricopeptide repeat protein [Burkholderia multivorans]KVR44954.1 hypothetical protein WK17_11490 [Burkholderia multivorans]
MVNLAAPPDGEFSEQQPSSLRLAVYEVSGDTKKALAKLEVSAKLDGTCDVKISSESDTAANEIRDLLDRKRSERSEQPQQNLTDEQTLEKAGAKLKEILAEEGYKVEVLPAADHTLSFVMDMRTGAMIGTHTPLHDAIASDSDAIAQRIFDSLATKFKQDQDELAGRISTAITEGLHADAMQLVCQAYESGSAGLPPTELLLDALHSVDLSAATDEQRLTVLKWRTLAAEALGKSDVAATAAEELLSGWGHTFSAEQVSELRMILAAGAMKRGSKETALMLWRELLNEPRSLGAGNRGWAWRNISFALPVDDPEALRAARYSADAFMEAGDKNGAAKSLMQVANCLLHSEPTQALAAIDEILPLLDSDALAYRPVKAATLHARANRLMKLGRYTEAAADAQSAVDLWRGIMGTESELVSSLYLAAFAAEGAGDKAANIRLKSEADKLAAALPTSRFALGNRLLALSEVFNKEDADKLAADAIRDGDHDVVASVRYVQASNDVTLSDSSRLMLLEEGLNALEKVNSRSSMVTVLQCAIGNQLTKMSQYKRARGWYEKVLKTEPLDKSAREGLLNCLWQAEAWAEAVLFLKSQLALLGEMPGLMFAYGRSMFEAGDMPGAFRALRKAEELAESMPHVKANASALAQRALALAGTIPPLTQASDPPLPVTLDDLDQELERFSSFVAGAKRMVFWTKLDSSADYDWIAKPERQAQHLLHTFLKARFLDRIDVFEEIATGAGRLDIYVQLHGGLSAVIELKMCGFGYSSSYASAGEEQIVHYMSNRRSAIGYLVVFDARLNDFATPLTEAPRQDSLTIRSHFVDVRPRVSARGNKKR